MPRKKADDSKDFLRTLALIGARARLTVLESEVAEMKSTIKLLQGAGTTSTATKKKVPKNGRRKAKRRQHSPEFKAQVVAESKTGSITKTAKQYHLSRSLVDKWVAKSKKGK